MTGLHTKTVASESYLNDETFAQEENEILIDLMNPESVDKPISECYEPMGFILTILHRKDRQSM